MSGVPPHAAGYVVTLCLPSCTMTDPPPRFDKRLLAIFAVALIAAGAPFLFLGQTGKGKVAWFTSHADAVTKASDSKRPVFIYFTATWCGPCQQMKKYVFPDAAVADTLNQQFVPVMIETTENTPQNLGLSQQYHVKFIPMMVITDAEGTVLAERTGRVGASDLVDWLKTHRQSDETR